MKLKVNWKETTYKTTTVEAATREEAWEKVEEDLDNKSHKILDFKADELDS